MELHVVFEYEEKEGILVYQHHLEKYWPNNMSNFIYIYIYIYIKQYSLVYVMIEKHNILKHL